MPVQYHVHGAQCWNAIKDAIKETRFRQDRFLIKWSSSCTKKKNVNQT